MRSPGVAEVEHARRVAAGETGSRENRKGQKQSPRTLIAPVSQDLGHETMQGLTRLAWEERPMRAGKPTRLAERKNSLGSSNSV